MIFVILGIIILVISFAVALISLIREQKREVAEKTNDSFDSQAKNIPNINAETPTRISQVQNPSPIHQTESSDYKLSNLQERSDYKLSNLQERSDYKFPW